MNERRDADSAKDRVREEPQVFSFFQAVRILELEAEEGARVGMDNGPDDEGLAFSVHPSLAFPASEIQKLESGPDGDRMEVNFLGLTGPMGVLPYEYTREIIHRVRRGRGDPTLQDFLDLFHHRIISLFYRAWEKNRYAFIWERGGRHALVDHVMELEGLAPGREHGTGSLPAEALAGYGSRIAPQSRSAIELEAVIRDYFDVTCVLEPFVGEWVRLESWDLCRLGESETAPVQLGGGAVVGDEVWDVHARARITLGPLPRERFDDFLPGGHAHQALRDLVRFWVDDTVGFDLQLLLERDDVSGVVLDKDRDQRLGWSTWMNAEARADHGRETVIEI